MKVNIMFWTELRFRYVSRQFVYMQGNKQDHTWGFNQNAQIANSWSEDSFADWKAQHCTAASVWEAEWHLFKLTKPSWISGSNNDGSWLKGCLLPFTTNKQLCPGVICLLVGDRYPPSSNNLLVWSLKVSGSEERKSSSSSTTYIFWHFKHFWGGFYIYVDDSCYILL